MKQYSEIEALQCLINDLQEQERYLILSASAETMPKPGAYPFIDGKEMIPFTNEKGYRLNFLKTNFLQAN
jgi:hypothetical protein